MFCTKCGNKIADNSKFCSKCGAAIANKIINDKVEIKIDQAAVSISELKENTNEPVVEENINAPKAEENINAPKAEESIDVPKANEIVNESEVNRSIDAPKESKTVYTNEPKVSTVNDVKPKNSSALLNIVIVVLIIIIGLCSGFLLFKSNVIQKFMDKKEATNVEQEMSKTDEVIDDEAKASENQEDENEEVSTEDVDVDSDDDSKDADDADKSEDIDSKDSEEEDIEDEEDASYEKPKGMDYEDFLNEVYENGKKVKKNDDPELYDQLQSMFTWCGDINVVLGEDSGYKTEIPIAIKTCYTEPGNAGGQTEFYGDDCGGFRVRKVKGSDYGYDNDYYVAKADYIYGANWPGTMEVLFVEFPKDGYDYIPLFVMKVD